MSATQAHNLEVGELVTSRYTGNVGMVDYVRRNHDGDIVVVGVDFGTHTDAFLPRELTRI